VAGPFITPNSFPNPFGTGIQALPESGIVNVVGVVTFVESVSLVLGITEAGASVALSQTVDTARTLLVLQGVDARRTVARAKEPETFSVTANISGAGTDVVFERFNPTSQNPTGTFTPTAVNCFASVMEFSAGTVITQRATITVGSTATTGTATITAVDTAKTIIIDNGVKVHGFIGETGEELRWWLHSLVLTNSTTVTAERGPQGTNPDTELTIEAMALEFL
jgi:hypothetical protein